MKSVTAKFATMRKPQEFTVYPFNEGDKTIVVQSDKAIGQFDAETGVGVLNYKGSNSKYFLHLNKILGAVDFTFPKEFVEACKSSAPKSGDHIGGGIFIA